MKTYSVNNPMFLLSFGAIINKVLGVLRTVFLIYLVGDSLEYSEILGYIYLVQLFTILFDYSFLNTLFTETAFEKSIINKLLIIAFIFCIFLSFLVFVNGNLLYASMSILYYIFSLISSIAIVMLSRMKHFKFYIVSSIISSIILLLSVFFISISISVLYLGRIISVIPLVIGFIIVQKEVELSNKELSLRGFIRKIISSIKMNKTTIAMILVPLFLSLLDYNLTYFAYAMAISGAVNTVLVRNSQLLTMARISNSWNFRNWLYLCVLLTCISLMLPSDIFMLKSFDLVLLLRYILIIGSILIFLGKSDIELAKNVANESI